MGNITVKELERKPMNFLERTYVPEIIRGLSVTITHMFRNLNPNKAERTVVTVQYPEEKVTYPERYRGMHRLMKRDDGQVRCVACMCCSTICPADCIHIEAAEHDDPTIEKYPHLFVIDELRCIVCGLCVEVCPCDAIRMDTAIHVPPFIDRTTSFYDRDFLLQLGGPSRSTQGGGPRQFNA